MSADLYLRALTDRSHAPLLQDWGRGDDPVFEAFPHPESLSEEEVAQMRQAWDDRTKELQRLEAIVRPFHTPDVWIGQVSWTKAGLFADTMPNAWRRYVPRVVETIQRLYDSHDGVVEMTPSIRSAITTAFSLPHDSWYESGRVYYYDNPRDEPTGKWYDRSRRTANGFWFRPRYPMRGIAKARNVKKWCDEHMGQLTFVTSD